MNAMTLYWIIFISIFLIVFAIDFYVTDHRKGELSVSQALKWAGTWVAIALLFGMAIFFFFPQNEGIDPAVAKTSTVMGIKFIAGYLTEYSLSVDNLFVFIMIFSMMGISSENQPKLLKLGILISIVLRILFILVGMSLVQRFEWIIYVFGAILVYTAFKMLLSKDEDNVDPSSNILYKGASKLFPIDPDTHSSKFFTKINGKKHITVIFLCLLVIGSTDILFAIDSIPAIIGVINEGAKGILTVSEENFLAISSNVFAVMGLVSLFFALKGIMGMFRFLKQGVCIILLFIGVKMILGWWEPVSHFFHDHSWVSLAVIIGTLLFSIILSRIIPEKVAEEKLNEKN
ncbi:MAG: TerC/Alx family metal homeostasis membrane protein [Bacteroidales bacterium]|nr:TerC/Alx family metal homeostasis membrane protein [Bacteroidales bacterium]